MKPIPQLSSNKTVTAQFQSERLGTFFLNSNNEVYQLKRLPIQQSTDEPRVLYLQNWSDAKITILETNRIEWELTTRP